MTKNEAVAIAVRKVREFGETWLVLRRGDKYSAQPNICSVPRGWKLAESIGLGNVHNF